MIENRAGARQACTLAVAASRRYRKSIPLSEQRTPAYLGFP